MRGQALTSVLIGLVVFGVCWVVGVPGPLPLAVIATFADLIPFVGGAILLVVVVLATLPLGLRPVVAVALVIFGYLQVENHLLMPRIYGQQLQLSLLAVVIALLIGVRCWAWWVRCWRCLSPPSFVCWLNSYGSTCRVSSQAKWTSMREMRWRRLTMRSRRWACRHSVRQISRPTLAGLDRLPAQPVIMGPFQGAEGWVARRNQPLAVANPESDVRFAPYEPWSGPLAGDLALAVAAVPVRTSVGLVGVLSVLDQIGGEAL